MLLKILKKDISRGRVVNATLLLFILLAALLTAVAAGLMVELGGSMEAMFRAAAAPHFVQMHAGEIVQADIDAFAAAQPMVTGQQTVEMLNIGGAQLYLGRDRPEADSVMENAFVVQNQRFDFLLDMQNNVFHPQPGEVGVPVYYLQNGRLALGDAVRVGEGDAAVSFTVAAFLRDAQMNPAVVTSKRFAVHQDDWQTLKERFGESEYLIEFLLTDPALAADFEALYQASGLPGKDTAVTWSLYRLLNALTDGIVIGVIVLIALLLMVIALLCLRFTINAAIEQDYREIGVMKALGLPMKAIRGVYMSKYMLLAGVGCILGYLLSLPLGRLLSSNITLYMGRARQTPARYLAPIAGCGVVFLLVWGFCRAMLRALRRITPVEAMRRGSLGTAGRNKSKRFQLHRSGLPWTNAFLGVRDVLGHPRRYAVLALVFFLCVFLMLLPLNLLTTVQSPDFISYMGAARSDIRIDLFRTGNVEAAYTDMLETLAADPEVLRFAPLVTAAYTMESDDGDIRSIKLESGDFSVFPLAYLEGRAPRDESEIALSAMNADDLGKSPGDTLRLQVEGAWRELTVCGIYQDVTNGGKTAKGMLPWRHDDVLWYVVNADIRPDVALQAKLMQLEAAFPTARVLDMEAYLGQTLGGTVDQLRLAAGVALAVSVAVAVCVTALFFRMLMAGDAREIAIMRAMGISGRSVGVQYGARALLVLLLGVAAGTLAVATLGESIAGALGSLIGASSIRFIVNGWLAWLLYPLCLVLPVILTTLLCGRGRGEELAYRQFGV